MTRVTVYEDLDKLIYEEAKVTNSPHQFNQLFSKVFDFIINKVNDINDWPEACMYNLNDKVVLVELAELLHNATEYDSDLRPWYLDIWNTGYGSRTYRFKLKEANSELYTKRYLTNEVDNERNVYCLRPVRIHSSWEDDCSVFFHDKPDENDWIISVLFNPDNQQCMLTTLVSPMRAMLLKK